MIKDEAQARDEMAMVLQLAWNAQDWASYGLEGLLTAPEIKWQGRGGDAAFAPDAPAITWAAHHAREPQAALSDDIGNRLYEPSGILVMQSRGALILGNGFEVAERLAIIAKEAYRGKSTSNCIWFRNARTQEVGADAGWYLFNTYVEFEYNEVG